MGCSGCGNNNNAKSKLGTCKFCMTSNLLGAIIGWLTFCFFFFLNHIEKVALVALIIASFFSIFFIVHMVFYFIINRKNKKDGLHP